jgi:PAS domain S-box-containing protein
MEAQLQQLRNNLINRVYLAFIIFYIPAACFSVLRATQTGWQSIYMFHLFLIVLGTMVFLLRRKLSLPSKTHIVCIIFLGICFFGTYAFGVSGGYYTCILSIVISTLIFGKRSGYAYLAISIIGLITLAVLHYSKIIHTEIDFNTYNFNVTTWINLMFGVFWMLLIIVFAIGLFYDLFQQNIEALIAQSSEQKTAQEKIISSEKRYRSLIDQASDPIMITDFTGNFVDANTSLCTIFGYTKEELLTMNIATLLDAQQLSEKPIKFADLARGKHILSDRRMIKKDGSFIEVEANVKKIDDNNIMAIARDITERKAMEFERFKIINDLLQRNRDLEQFAYIVSHNLRAPVTNIIGITDYLQDTEMKPEERDEMNHGLRTSVSQLDTVIKDLNNILQMKQREISEKKEKVKFSKLLDDIKLSIATLLEEEKVVFITDFNEVDKIMTIKSYMHSIFYNLISNSIKYKQHDSAPIIEIKSKISEHKMELIFKDNGLGIDVDKKGDQIFGLYKRFHTHAEGKGMGLYMVKTQVETLGGKISIKSKINQGTEFRIVFENEIN